MIESDAAVVLALCATFDRRTIGRADATAWGRLLGDLSVQDCCEAVDAWYTERRDWIMPSDVITAAKRIRDRRIGRARLAELDAQIAAENAGDFDPKPIEAGDPAPSVALAMREAVANRPRKPPAGKPRPDPERMKQARAEVDGVRTEVVDA